MAILILGSSLSFTKELNTDFSLTIEEAEYLYEVVENLLKDYNSDLIWLPESSEIGIDIDIYNFEIEMISKEYDIKDIIAVMDDIWVKAYEILLN